jgi:hypothetical protein
MHWQWHSLSALPLPIPSRSPLPTSSRSVFLEHSLQNALAALQHTSTSTSNGAIQTLDSAWDVVVPTEALEDADVPAVGAAAALRERGQAERAKRQTHEFVTLGSNGVNDAAAAAVSAAGGAAALQRAMHRDASLSSYVRYASVNRSLLLLIKFLLPQ